jgi:hypothetical protein
MRVIRSLSALPNRKTVRKYLRPAEEAGITPGWPPMSEADWAKLIKNCLLDRLINTSHQVIMNGPSYRNWRRGHASCRDDLGVGRGIFEMASGQYRRDPLAGADWCPLAGSSCGVRAVADGLWALPSLAARWCLVGRADRVAGPCRSGWADHVGK